MRLLFEMFLSDTNDRTLLYLMDAHETDCDTYSWEGDVFFNHSNEIFLLFASRNDNTLPSGNLT